MTGVAAHRGESRDTRVGRVLAIALSIGFAALLAAVLGAIWAMRQNEIHTGWVNHSYEVEQATTDAGRLLEQAETARRGYLLTASPAIAGIYNDATSGLARTLGEVRALSRDNPDQQRRLGRIATLLQEQTSAQIATMRAVARGDIAGAQASFRADRVRQRMQAIRLMFAAMVAEERTLLRARDADQRRSLSVLYAMLAIAGVTVVVVGGVVLLTVLRYTKRLGQSRDQLRTLADSLDEQVTVRTADLTRANEEIQRFAYIVSHDLRAPLVNVMGFTAELDAASATVRALIDRAEAQCPDVVDEEARLAAREDLPEAIGFIRTSTQKMDRLINAILTLSRQGRRVLTPETIDVAAMVAAIGDSLAQQLESRDGALAVEGTLPHLEHDRLAIEQIFSNLIENAVKYADPARPLRIVVRGARQGPTAWFEIADNGRGIDPKDHARVFDLFRRSGRQDQPGEGIGLAHVRALAYRLGGTITLASALGEGATFRVTLPIHLPTQQASE